MIKDYKSLARLFKDLGNPVRLKVIILLIENKQKCLCELQPILKISEPALSRHINLLIEHKIIAQKREKNRFSLSLKDKNVLKIVKCLKTKNNQIYKKVK